MKAQILKSLINKLYRKALELKSDAYSCAINNDYENEHNLIAESLKLSERVSSYEVLVSNLDLNNKINIRPMSYMERLENRIHLIV